MFLQTADKFKFVQYLVYVGYHIDIDISTPVFHMWR